MGLWRYRSPSRRDFYEVEEIFPAASYQYVLYGMEFQPEKQRPRYSDNAELAARLFAENSITTERFLAGLPLNRELINHVSMHGMLDI